MLIATSNPNEYLVVGRGGKVVNRGTGIRVFLWPGSMYVLIPSTKLEATFEMTQETRDGIPLRFKGIVIDRVTHPEWVAVNFNFNGSGGVEEINTLIRHICLGELRAAVSGMTLQECIEQRKTVLTAAVDAALRQVALGGSGGEGTHWGIEFEMVQVAQVFIMDNDLRRQLEAEVRNNIRAHSDQSDIRTREETRLVQLASDLRVQEQNLVTQKEAVRQKEELELANLQARHRVQVQDQEIARDAIRLATEKFNAEQDAERQRTETEAPVRLLQVEKQRALLEQELELRQIENQVRALEVKRDMLLEQARQELRKEILPIEQIPALAEALSKSFQGANLSFFGSENQLLASLLPLLDILSKRVQAHLNDMDNPTGGSAG